MHKFNFTPKSEKSISLPGVHAALSGRVAWELYDPEMDQVVQSGEQSNLILNQGLDLFGTTSGYGGFRDYFCVGEGSSAPTVTQTALDSERVRSNSTGGFADSTSGSYNATTKLYTGTFVINRVITFTAGQNFVLTEFGFAAGPSGNLSIRELFRDGGGAPTTITDTASKQLRMTHTLTVTLTGDWTQAVSVPITGVGTVTGVASFFATSTSIQNLITGIWHPAASPTSGLFSAISALPTHGGSTSLSFTGSAGTPINMTVAAYVSGSYSRKKTRVYSTSTGNGSVLGIPLQTTTNINTANEAYLLKLDSGFTKTSSQQLTIEFTVSWGRA